MTIVEGERNCSGCGKSEVDEILLTIGLPPLIRERTELCRSCLDVAIQASKTKKKELES